MKGFIKDKKFHPIRNYIGVKKHENNNSSVGVLIRKKRYERDEPLDFTIAVRRFEDFRDATDLRGYTFDPITDMGYDFFDQKQTKKFYDRFVNQKDKGKTLFQIGLTNNILPTTPRDLEAEYESAKKDTNTPMFGFFRDIDGIEFTDISRPYSGISEFMALEIARDKIQRVYFRIFPTGKVTVLRTGIESEKAVSKTPF